MKFGRVYRLDVQGHTKPWTFQYPQANGADGGLTLHFNVNRHALAGLNTGTFALYNLAPGSRSDLFYDALAHPAELRLSAGYASQNSMSNIFDGEIFSSYPERQHTEVILRMSGIDGLWGTSNAQIPQPGTILPANTPLSIRAGTMMSLLSQYGVSYVAPKLSAKDDILSGAVETPTGLVWDWLIANAPPGGRVFIDNGIAYFASQGLAPVAPSNGVTTITDAMGLLEIPRKTEYITTVSMMFEPSFNVGQPVGLDTSLNLWANVPFPGYEIISVNHSGVISPVESGDAITTLELIQVTAPVPAVA